MSRKIPIYKFDTKDDTGIDKIPNNVLVICSDYNGKLKKFRKIDNEYAATDSDTLEQCISNGILIPDLDSKFLGTFNNIINERPNGDPLEIGDEYVIEIGDDYGACKVTVMHYGENDLRPTDKFAGINDIQFIGLAESTRRDGSPLRPGDICFNITRNGATEKYWTGKKWVEYAPINSEQFFIEVDNENWDDEKLRWQKLDVIIHKIFIPFTNVYKYVYNGTSCEFKYQKKIINEGWEYADSIETYDESVEILRAPVADYVYIFNEELELFDSEGALDGSTDISYNNEQTYQTYGKNLTHIKARNNATITNIKKLHIYKADNITDMSYFFAKHAYYDDYFNGPWSGISGCQEFTTDVDGSLFSNVTNFTAAFAFMIDVKEFPKINTSSATTLQNMFTGCYSLEKIDDVYDATNVTSVKGMFQNCKKLQWFEGLINTDNITDYSYMFNRCKQLKNIGYLDTEGGTDFTSFLNDTAIENLSNFVVRSGTINFLNAIDLDGLISSPAIKSFVLKYDSTKCIKLRSLLKGCNSLETFSVVDVSKTDVDEQQKFDIGNCTITSSMFEQCYSLKIVPEFVNFSNVIQAKSMFQDCYSLETLPKGLDTSNCKYLQEYVANCISLKCMKEFNTTESVESSGTKSTIFQGCINLQQPDETAITDLTSDDGASWTNSNDCKHLTD